MLADLNEFFEKAPADMHWNAYYNHANEPVHLVPFLFNRLGEPWSTQRWTRFICRQAYADKVEGIVGNEDAGQMSAWYVLAAAGIHPACPGRHAHGDHQPRVRPATNSDSTPATRRAERSPSWRTATRPRTSTSSAPC